jgi:hypothetical protein
VHDDDDAATAAADDDDGMNAADSELIVDITNPNQRCSTNDTLIAIPKFITTISSKSAGCREECLQ